MPPERFHQAWLARVSTIPRSGKLVGVRALGTNLGRARQDLRRSSVAHLTLTPAARGSDHESQRSNFPRRAIDCTSLLASDRVSGSSVSGLRHQQTARKEVLVSSSLAVAYGRDSDSKEPPPNTSLTIM
jgi:hypothetical protein